MIRDSPLDALEFQAEGLRDLIIKVVRARHERAAEAHETSESRYGMGFGSQWRDLLDDVHDALKNQGFQSHKLTPAGHNIPVVNNCLVYVWRVPNNPNAVSKFASSPTRKNVFETAPLDPTLWEPCLEDRHEPSQENPDASELGLALREVGDTMPLVLVMVESTPRQLQSIDWAVATLDDAGEVRLRGHERIWEPELVTEDSGANMESFDSGTPSEPSVELQEQEYPHNDE
jgi:hypothetical protein